MNNSYIQVSVIQVKQLALAELGRRQVQAEKEFAELIDSMVAEFNEAVKRQHEKVKRREKSILRFFMTEKFRAEWLRYHDFGSAELCRKNVIAEYKEVVSAHRAYRFEFINGDIVGDVVEHPSVNWPDLWKLASIHVKDIEQGFKFNGLPSHPAIVYLSTDHARLIGLIS